MLVIHTRGDRLSVPRSRLASDGLWEHWYAYVDGSRPHQIVVAAIDQLRQRILTNPDVLDACNERYMTISRGRHRGQINFQSLIEDPEPRITLSRCPVTQYFGVTSGNHISIAHLCFSPRGAVPAVDVTAGTILHELAHVVGATGNTTGPGHFIAESVVLACGYPQVFQRGGGG